MAAFQQLHRPCLHQEEARLARTADVVISLSDVVVEEEDTTTGDHTTIGDQVEVFHLVNGGGVKHHRSVSPATVEEEEAALVLEDRTATGMGEEEEDGDLSWITPSHQGGHYHRGMRVRVHCSGTSCAEDMARQHSSTQPQRPIT